MSYGGQNPKAYYNHSEYTSGTPSAGAGASGGSSSSSRADPSAAAWPSSKAYDTATYKPDDVAPSMPSGPPPPYNFPPPHEPVLQPAAPLPSSEYPTYGAVAPQAGLLDPARAYMDRQPRPPPSPSSSSRGPVAKPPAPWVNPHIPREWAQSGYNQGSSSGSSMPPSPTPPMHIRFGPRPRDDDDDDDDESCWIKWCKYLFLGILIWLVFLKYGDILQWGGWGDSPSANGCHSHNSLQWNDLPSSIRLDRNARVSVDGHVTGGTINVHRGSRKGSIETRVRTSSPVLLEALEYDLQYPADGMTELALRFPAVSSIAPPNDCLELEMDIWVPEHAQEIHVAGSNVIVNVVDALDSMEWLDIKTVNAMIVLQGGWFGDRLELEAVHAEIQCAGPIVVNHAAHLVATSGAIRVASIMSGDTVELKTTNAPIKVSGSLQADQHISAHTSNGKVSIDTIKSRDATIVSSNGRIDIGHAAVPYLTAQTSNAAIDLHMEIEVQPAVQLTTSNGPITAHVTTLYAGDIQVSTSANNKAIVQDAWNRVDLTIDEPSVKQGNRMRGHGSISLITSQADAGVYLDISI